MRCALISCFVAASAACGQPGGLVADAVPVVGDGSDLPEPIPVIDEEPPALCAGPHPADYYQFLDDICRAKRLPSHVDPEGACPTVDVDAAGYRPGSVGIVLENVLDGIVPPELGVVVIEIRRIGGVPHFRYLSNGSGEDAVQPWSSTKWLAAANAAARLRRTSSGQVGLTASVSGYPLGDLVTSMTNYDAAAFTSNALGRYFHDIGGRAAANELIHAAWLGRPASETFGGNYGEPSPALGFTFVDGNGATVTLAPDQTTGPQNRLSMLTLAEALKRTVLFREEPTRQIADLTWPDVRTLLYGAAASTKYGEWGGLSADTAIYMQSAHDWDYIERRARGRWRVFSKLGLGTAGQFVNVGYACLPVLDASGKPIVGWGRELVIAAHLASGAADYAARDRMLARAFRAILVRVVDGRL